MNETGENPLRRFLARVISGGRVTIPEEIRLVHGIKENHIVELEIINVLSGGKEKGGRK